MGAWATPVTRGLLKDHAVRSLRDSFVTAFTFNGPWGGDTPLDPAVTQAPLRGCLALSPEAARATKHNLTPPACLQKPSFGWEPEEVRNNPLQNHKDDCQ